MYSQCPKKKSDSAKKSHRESSHSKAHKKSKHHKEETPKKEKQDKADKHKSKKSCKSRPLSSTPLQSIFSQICMLEAVCSTFKNCYFSHRFSHLLPLLHSITLVFSYEIKVFVSRTHASLSFHFRSPPVGEQYPPC